MLISRLESDRRKKPGFAWWRMLAWVLLLFAAFGGAQYIRHAQQVWGVLQTLPPGDDASASALHGMLAWDLGYLAAAFVVIVACAGCIMRLGWARSLLRIVALVLCVWSAYRGMLLWHQWTALSQAGGTAFEVHQLMDLRRILLIGFVLRGAAVLILLWLVWHLGQPAVRLQFRSKPG